MPVSDADDATAAFRAAAELRAGLRDFLRSSERVLGAHGLTRERYELLLAIKGAADGSERATVGELANVLGVALSSVTQLARRAEDAGLLRRQVSGTDARVRYLRLTRTGERRLARAVADLGPERERLADVCARLAGSLDPVHVRTASARRDGSKPGASS